MASHSQCVANQVQINHSKLMKVLFDLIKIPIKIVPLTMSYCFSFEEKKYFTKLIGTLGCNLVETRGSFGILTLRLPENSFDRFL